MILQRLRQLFPSVHPLIIISQVPLIERGLKRLFYRVSQNYD